MSIKTFNDDLLVRLYLNILLIESERLYKKQAVINESAQSRKELLTAKFKALVSAHLKDRLKISDYAKLLFVHPHYLNDIIREITGESASDHVKSQFLSEAKSYLIQTDYTIAEIAEFLNFTDQSYFTRFFKKNTKSTPTQFRAEHMH